MADEGKWLASLPSLASMFFPFRSSKWWCLGQPWKPCVEDEGIAITLWMLEWLNIPSGLCARKNFCCVGAIIFWVYLSPQFSLLQLTPSPGILVIPSLCSVTQITSLKPTTVPISSSENQRCGESTQGKTDRRKHLHGSAIDIWADGCCCSNCIRYHGCTCFTDVHVQHGYF